MLNFFNHLLCFSQLEKNTSTTCLVGPLQAQIWEYFSCRLKEKTGQIRFNSSTCCYCITNISVFPFFPSQNLPF